MARKRASLKDKNMESLNPKRKRSRGIDILFGESTEEEAETIPAVSEEAEKADLSQLDPDPPDEPVFMETEYANQPDEEKDSMPVNQSEETAAGDVPASEFKEPAATSASLPVNEADLGASDVVAAETVVDELGLPVALEAPPADLTPAVPMPEAAPSEIWRPVPAVDTSDLSGLGDEVDLSGLEAEGNVTTLEAEVDLSGLEAGVDIGGLEAEMSMESRETESDLSGLGTESGWMDMEPETDLSELESEVDLSGLESEPGEQFNTIPPANLPPAVPSAEAAPPGAGSAVSSPAGAPASIPAEPTAFSAVSPGPTPSGGPAFSTDRPTFSAAAPAQAVSASVSKAPGAGAASRVSMPRAKIEAVDGIVSERIRVTAKGIAPEDTQHERATNIFSIKQREKVTEDEAMAAKVTRFIGRERRENLDQEIEFLYKQVASDLSANKEDAEFALDSLRQAQDLVFEDPRQYDEALYLVATVRTMMARKRNMARWSYTWGLLVFFYAVVWLVIFIASFVYSNQLGIMLAQESNESVQAVLAAWFSALAGGIGGVIGILYSLYWHVAMKQDFDRQYVMYYLVQPIMGFVLGAVVYFIVASGSLLINIGAISSGATSSSEVLSSTTVIALQVLLGWIAGFRQRFVFEMIDKIVQKVSPRSDPEEAKKPISLVPDERRAKPSVALEVRNQEDATTSRVEIEKSESAAEAT